MKPYTFATHSLSNTLLFYNIVQNQLVQISCSYEYGKLNFGDIQSLFLCTIIMSFDCTGYYFMISKPILNTTIIINQPLLFL